MSKGYDHLRQVFEIECTGKGNAFLTDELAKEGLLITVRHVVEDGWNGVSSIWLNPGDGGKKIECEILTHDALNDEGSDKLGAFMDSTLVLLKAKGELPDKDFKEGKEAETKSQIQASVYGYLNGGCETHRIKGFDEDIPDKVEKTGERISGKLTMEETLGDMHSLSGAPIRFGVDDASGVFIAQRNNDGKAYAGYALYGGEYKRRMGIIRKRLKDLENKAAEKQILSFAEYVAEVCNDRPNGLPRLLGNPSEYTSRYPDQDISVHQKMLRAFWFKICNAGREIDIDSAKKIRDQALEILGELYCNSKQILDVYISALYGVLLTAYQERTSLPERMKAIKNLLDVAADDFEKDFPHRHLFLAEYYVASEESREALSELEEASKLCLLEWMNTNCYASICILRTCCRTPEGEVLKNETVLSNLAMAIRNRPDVCQFYICNTGAYRMMANYQANCAYFHDAVNSVEYAFGLDSKADSQKGCDDDHECFRSICSKALDYYVHQGFGSYEQWCTFRAYVARSPLYRQSYCGFEVEIQDKWIAALDRWNQNRFDLRGIKGLKYEEAEETEGFNHETFGKLLDQCVNVELFLRVLDLDEQTFEEERESRDKVLCKIPGLEEAVSIHKLENDAYLYIHEYKPDGKKTLPVWHLICPQR